MQLEISFFAMAMIYANLEMRIDRKIFPNMPYNGFDLSKNENMTYSKVAIKARSWHIRKKREEETKRLYALPIPWKASIDMGNSIESGDIPKIWLLFHRSVNSRNLWTQIDDF